MSKYCLMSKEFNRILQHCRLSYIIDMKKVIWFSRKDVREREREREKERKREKNKKR